MNCMKCLFEFLSLCPSSVQLTLSMQVCGLPYFIPCCSDSIAMHAYLHCVCVCVHVSVCGRSGIRGLFFLLEGYKNHKFTVEMEKSNCSEWIVSFACHPCKLVTWRLYIATC